MGNKAMQSMFSSRAEHYMSGNTQAPFAPAHTCCVPSLNYKITILTFIFLQNWMENRRKVFGGDGVCLAPTTVHRKVHHTLTGQ